ncbi:MAG TPA: ferrous iron transport protein B [Cyclobacteriaceae bacterium]|jgi:ferrous iron transport protein B|nr:ferrous iron transport protein B [Cytophagales bacterium]HRE65436.1 ferrous iron transport protein B [Cyclobacteriaceae bacterium]HRF32646.1 ferrous iron transport protein B [Cyclobacteriaceae bacterium]
MAAQKNLRIALAGKPNAGKSSLFNLLTGLNQKIGNFPGITVDKRTGHCQISAEITAQVMDLPGIYSLYPRTIDEKIVTDILADRNGVYYPDCVVLVADATNLKNCMLLLTQLIDLKIPTVLALNMMDLAARSGQNIDVQALAVALDLPVVMINARTGQGVVELKNLLATSVIPSSKTIYKVGEEIEPLVKDIQQKFNLSTPYQAYQVLQQTDNLSFLTSADKTYITTRAKDSNFFQHKYQGAETVMRYSFIQDLLNKVTLKSSDPEWKKFSHRIDKVLTHKVWGYLIFFSVLFLIFQSIFAWAQIPMDFIDSTFASLSNRLDEYFPDGPFFDLITQGIIPGIGGIVIFIPQIAILFACISILEESGYMARVVFLMDKLMRKFGLNGKSVVPLISGLACAIPAIMATRTIENWKDRLITIFVTPFMSCSARLPVFTILVALIIPDVKLFGFFNYQGLVLMGLYLLGFFAALISAFVLKLIIKTKERSYLIMEMPTYRWPKWSNVGYTIVEKTKSFVFEAGKVILAISIVLWVLASYGPGDAMNNAEDAVRHEMGQTKLPANEFEAQVASYKLEHSYAGIIGKALEPAIEPLGYDWKIGIALVTSFAAREVFVSTIATIYSLGGTEDEQTIKGRLRSEINPNTGGPRYTPAVGLSLLVFYTFAMQCMSTLAVVKRETKGWKWPLIQLAYMTALAYVSAFIIYQTLR